MLKNWKKELSEIYECIKGRWHFTLGLVLLIMHGYDFNHADEHKHNILVAIMSHVGMILSANMIYTGLYYLLDEREED